MSTAEAEKKSEARPLEAIERELAQAKQALGELQREQGGIRERLQESAGEDQQALADAALSGSLKKVKTPKLDAARQRAGELPYLLWAASIRALQLEEELVERRLEEVEKQIPPLFEAVEEAEAAYQQAQAQFAAAQDQHGQALEERRDLQRGRRQRQGRLAQLKEQGPEGI